MSNSIKYFLIIMLVSVLDFMLVGELRHIYIFFMLKGAIGSKFKIDASYLSPNVNISSRLEAATK